MANLSFIDYITRVEYAVLRCVKIAIASMFVSKGIYVVFVHASPLLFLLFFGKQVVSIVRILFLKLFSCVRIIFGLH